MSDLTKNAGCLTPYVKLLELTRPELHQQTIGYANRVKGFLCNYQIPLVYLFAATLRGRMVEIGCWYGRTTAILCAASEPGQFTLDCVDTFEGSEEHQKELKGYTFRLDFEQTLRDRGFRDRVKVHQMTSAEAAKSFPDNHFDAVWIDAAHDEANVRLDINAWLPKLKPGGFMFGHDYPEPTDPNGGFEELTRAVNSEVRDSVRFTQFGWFSGIWAAIKS